MAPVLNSKLLNCEEEKKDLNMENSTIIVSETTDENLHFIYKSLTDSEITQLLFAGKISMSKIESVVENFERAVDIRRNFIKMTLEKLNAINRIPYKDYDYSQIYHRCCENTIGYIQIPLGIVGPIVINDKSYYVPMATTEGCLVASTNRGCLVLRMSGGVKAYTNGDGMTRGPVLRFPSAGRAIEAENWILIHENFESIKTEFDSTSRFARLVSINSKVVGRHLYLRFKATTGNAMGMNMMSKGVEKALETIVLNFTDIEMSCLSGNYCTDKKSSFNNLIAGK